MERSQDYLQIAMICTSVVMPLVAATAVGIRFIARRTKKLPLKADDWVILLALILMIADCAGCIYATIHSGVGQILITLTPKVEANYFKFLLADVIIDHCTIGIIKISIILFYKRVFTIVWFRRVCNVALAFVGCWTVTAVFSALFAAHPISNWWKEAGHTTINFGVWSATMAALDLAQDVVVLLLPLPVINILQISTRRKISLLGIFWLGFFNFWSPTTNDIMFIPEHPVLSTYISNANTLWARIEIGSSIIAACLPTIAPLVRDFKPFESFISSFGLLFSRNPITGVRKEPSNNSDKGIGSPDLPRRGWLSLNTTSTANASESFNDSKVLLNAITVIDDRNLPNGQEIPLNSIKV